MVVVVVVVVALGLDHLLLLGGVVFGVAQHDRLGLGLVLGVVVAVVAILQTEGRWQLVF
jgi:hypothetical protein